MLVVTVLLMSDATVFAVDECPYQLDFDLGNIEYTVTEDCVLVPEAGVSWAQQCTIVLNGSKNLNWSSIVLDVSYYSPPVTYTFGEVYEKFGFLGSTILQELLGDKSPKGDVALCEVSGIQTAVFRRFSHTPRFTTQFIMESPMWIDEDGFFTGSVSEDANATISGYNVVYITGSVDWEIFAQFLDTLQIGTSPGYFSNDHQMTAVPSYMAKGP